MPFGDLERCLPFSMPPAFVLGDLDLVRPLSRKGVPVVAITSDPADPVLRSRDPQLCRVIPSLDSSPREACDAIVSLAERARRHTGGKPLLVYGSDEALELIHRFRSELKNACEVLLNAPGTAESLIDKQRFASLAASRGVPAPQTLGAGAPPLTIDELREPLVIKPAVKHQSTDWRRGMFGDAKARVVSRKCELEDIADFRALADRLVVQEYLDGDVHELVSFHGFSDETGRPLASFCGRKLRTFPMGSGESAFVELVNDDEVKQVGADAARRLGLAGPFKIDLARDHRDGRLKVLEVNARYTLWHRLGAVNGVNVPLIAYEYLVDGVAFDDPVEAYDVRYRWVDLYRDFQAFRSNGLSWKDWVGSIIGGKTVHETFSWADPMPAVQWLGGMAKQKVSNAALWRHR